MLAELLKHPKALGISLAFHAVLIGLIVVNLDFSDRPEQMKFGDVTQAVKAKVIDTKALEKKNKQEELEARRKKEAEQKIREAKEREKKQKQEAEKKRKAEQKRKREAETKRKADEKRKKEAEARRKADEKRKKEAEAKRKAEEKRKKEAEAKRIAEEKRKKEAEAKRKAEEERKRKEAEARRLAEEEQKRKEAELKAKLEAEENQRKLSSLREKYILAIRQKVERNWKRPAGSATMPECEVNVTQGPGGIILGVSFGACGGTETYRKSIENAVYKAEPLPKPEDPALFDRDLEFIFEP